MVFLFPKTVWSLPCPFLQKVLPIQGAVGSRGSPAEAATVLESLEPWGRRGSGEVDSGCLRLREGALPDVALA